MSLQEPVYNDGGDALYVMDQISDTKNKEERWVENLSLGGDGAFESESAILSSSAFLKGRRRWRLQEKLKFRRHR